MKKFLFLFSLMLMVGVMLATIGCGSSNKTGNDINPNRSFIREGTLQGKIMDALTGEAVGGDDLKVYLIQGINNRTPSKLITNISDPLAGEYAFSSIPVGIVNVEKELNFKIVVVKKGYQRFESDISIQASFAAGTDFTNEVFNRIGNVYLYPLGSSAGDVSVYVYSPQNMPIPNATVLLQQDVAGSDTISYTGDRLVATAGLFASLTGTTDSTGVATFSGDGLTLGGSYRIVVEALTFEGEQLATTIPTPFITGLDSTTRVVNMGPIGNSLFATSASNSIPGTITPNGNLTITFNQPILLSTKNFTAIVNDGGTFTTQTVTGVLSDGNMTLTLVPTITKVPTGKGATIAYTYDGDIFLRNSQAPTVYTLFTGAGTDVKNITTGDAVSGMVQLTSE